MNSLWNLLYEILTRPLPKLIQDGRFLMSIKLCKSVSVLYDCAKMCLLLSVFNFKIAVLGHKKGDSNIYFFMVINFIEAIKNCDFKALICKRHFEHTQFSYAANTERTDVKNSQRSSNYPFKSSLTDKKKYFLYTV
jgi:hypothetical protein